MGKKMLTAGAEDTRPIQADSSDSAALMAEESADASAVANAEAAPTTPQEAEKPDGCAAGFYCYIGPNLTGLIQHGAIYCGTREAALAAADAAIKYNPLIKTLIVSGDKLPEARLKVKKPGNALYQNYRRILGR